MKRIIVFCSFLVCILHVNSQVFLIDTFYLDATKTLYGIYADVNSSSDACIFFDMEAPNEQQRVQCKLSIGTRIYLYPANTTSGISTFISALSKAKEKYTNWKKLAEESSVSMFSKKMPIPINDQTIYFTQDEKWYCEKGVDMTVLFSVNANKQAFCVIESDYMTSTEVVGHSSSIGISMLIPFTNTAWGLSSNSTEIVVGKYCDGASLTFSSEKEIDTFIQKLINVSKWKKDNISIGNSFN